MASSGDQDIPTLQTGNLRPYLTLTILQIESTDWPREFKKLLIMLRNRVVQTRGAKTVIVADGIDTGQPEIGENSVLDPETHDVDAFIVRREKAPSWMKIDSAYTDTC